MAGASEILIVDDNIELCAALSDVLNECGLTADVAHDGAEALELASQNSYKLALLDFWMPGIDGVELFARLRASRLNLAGIMITAFLTREAETGAISSGILRIFSKPVDLTVLLSAIQEILSST